MKTLLSLFQGPGGDLSSKRLFGLVCLVIAAISTFTGGDIGIVGLWLGTGAGVLGIQAITKS